jgi:hypothetical protein
MVQMNRENRIIKEDKEGFNMKKKKAIRGKKKNSSMLNMEVGMLGFVVLILVGALICGCTTAWSKSVTYTASTEIIIYI